MKCLIFFLRLSLLLSFLTLTSCPLFYKDPVILQINSQKWTYRQFAKLLAQKIQVLNIKDIQNEALLENIKEQLIGDLLMAHLVHQWAKTHSVFISPEELNRALKKIQKGYPSEEVFFLYLKRKKISKAEWKKIIKNKLLYEKVSQKISSQAKEPTEKEMREYYQNHLSFFKSPPQVLIHHLFHKKKAPLLKVKQALELEKNLIAGAKRFLKNSQIIRAKWVKKNTLPVFDKAFTLKKNEISPIWPSTYAYHIIQVLDKKPAQVSPFSVAKEQIRKTLLRQKRKALFAKWLDIESRKANILKNNSALKKIKVKVL